MNTCPLFKVERRGTLSCERGRALQPRRTEDDKGIHPVPRGLRLAALQMMYKHIDAFLYLGAHEFRNSGRGTFCWEVNPVWLRQRDAVSSAIAARLSDVRAPAPAQVRATFQSDHLASALDRAFKYNVKNL